MEPVRIDSFCQFHFVSNPGFSPDGRYIAFVVRQADLKSNSYPGNLYFYDTEKDSYSQLTTSGKVTSYIWLDEKNLLYPEGKTEEGGSKTIYHQIFMDGGEAFPLFEVPVKADVAMTGEITLRGRVLPIGGLKEKLLAAKKAGIHMVLVPEKNEPDVRELDAEITDGLQIEFVGSMEQVLKLALVEKK